MAKDYGQSRRYHQSRRSYSAPKQLGWLVATFLGGYLTATVFDFTSLSAWINSHVLDDSAPSSHLAARSQKEALPKPKFEFYTLLSKDAANRRSIDNPQRTEAVASKPTVLVSTPQPAVNVTNQLASSTTPSAGPKALSAIQAAAVANLSHPVKPVIATTEAKALQLRPPIGHNSERYTLQIASFKARSDAEHMKAQLTLKGFNVSVVAISQLNTQWFRVILGPYSSKEQALLAQRSIAKSERLNGMIRKDA